MPTFKVVSFRDGLTEVTVIYSARQPIGLVTTLH
jgi:hypothetical protein